jgi:hypothetical protein
VYHNLAPAYLQTKFYIDNDDIQIVNSFGARSKTQMQKFVRDFYSWLPSLRECALSEMLNIKNGRIAYWNSLFCFEVDQQYIDIRRYIGKVHVIAGLSFSGFCAEIFFAVDWWTRYLDKMITDEVTKQKTLRAFGKLRMLDMALFTDFYVDRFLSQMGDISNRRAKVIEHITKAFDGLAMGEVNIEYASLSNTEEQFSRAFKKLTTRLREIVKQAKNIALGDYSIHLEALGPNDELGTSLVSMTDRLRELDFLTKSSNWIKIGQAEMGNIIKGDQNINSLAQKTLRFLCRRSGALLGTFYFSFDDDGQKRLRIIGTFAADEKRRVGKEVSFKNTLVGKAALSKQITVLSGTQVGHVGIDIGFGTLLIRDLVMIPIMLEDEVYGVLELGSYKPFSEHHMQFILQQSVTIASLIKTIKDRVKIKNLLEESKVQNLKLQIQQEKLRKNNDAITVRRARSMMVEAS